MSVSNIQEIRKVALVTGITGQDGSYLAELLLEKGYEVRTFERTSFETHPKMSVTYFLSGFQCANVLFLRLIYLFIYIDRYMEL